MTLILEPYLDQRRRWPVRGRHILAQFDERSVVVYQAYRPAIGHYAARNRRFGGDFSFSRMSWVKPNFLWMMYRSGWGTKPDQEVVLAVMLRREGFDQVLAEAVPSSYDRASFADRAAWQEAVNRSSVRLQWDPDHDPIGRQEERRAIQLGLRDEVLRRYASEWILDIEDVSALVAAEREHRAQRDWPALRVPREEVYPVTDAVVATRLGLAPPPAP